MKIDYSKAVLFFKNIWKAMAGIWFEILLVSFFIFAGFIVSLFSWGILK